MAAATFLQLSIQTQVSGAHPGPRQPSGIFPFRQRTSKSSSLTDSVCKLKLSNFPLKSHSPEMMKWGKRLPSSLTTEPNMHPTAFVQHSKWERHVSLRSHRRESTGAPARSRRQVCVSLSGSDAAKHLLSTPDPEQGQHPHGLGSPPPPWRLFSLRTGFPSELSGST